MPSSTLLLALMMMLAPGARALVCSSYDNDEASCGGCVQGGLCTWNEQSSKCDTDPDAAECGDGPAITSVDDGGSLLDLLAERPELSTLVELIGIASEALGGGDDLIPDGIGVTLLAPTNAAFSPLDLEYYRSGTLEARRDALDIVQSHLFRAVYERCDFIPRGAGSGASPSAPLELGTVQGSVVEVEYVNGSGGGGGRCGQGGGGQGNGRSGGGGGGEITFTGGGRTASMPGEQEGLESSDGVVFIIDAVLYDDSNDGEGSDGASAARFKLAVVAALVALVWF